MSEPGAEAAVACPNYGETASVRVSDGADDADLVVRPYVAAWGNYETVTCSAGHRFWVYVC